ncbi:PREDICTED: uncharacterized protein LOC104810458 [Tarenaya hassleriana]|uniref:uncharacterized protein LOC104810458 n=1 Tax=Tarenaya hassleriana TaxID=28532 RepID=UPI00053C5D2D|nr:PREDICTED: uncharacterized protein LOC104810458 [Tarenaya hassleriana]
MRSLSGVRKYQSSLSSSPRKRSKKLAAICEEEYNRNHGEDKDGDGGAGSACVDSELLRRSSRLRRAPVILDASPPPAKRRRSAGKNDNRITKSSLGRGAKEESGDLDTPGVWKSRLRSRGMNSGFKGRGRRKSVVNGKRKLFDEQDGFEVGRKTVERKMGRKSGASNGRKPMKAEIPVKVKQPESSEDSAEQSDTSSAEDESLSNSEEHTDDESEAREDSEEDKKENNTTRAAVSESETEAEDEQLKTESEDGSGTEGTENETEDRDEGSEGETEGSAGGTGYELQEIMDDTGPETKTVPDALENEGGVKMEGMENETDTVFEDMQNEEVSVKACESTNGISNGKLEEDSSFVDKVQNEKGDILNPELQQEVFMESNEKGEQNEEKDELLDCHKEYETENQEGFIHAPKRSANKMGDDINSHGKRGEDLNMHKELPIENEAANKAVDSVRNSSERVGKPRFKLGRRKPRFKQGRRCGLCGVGTDGKPPKKLRHNSGDSDIDADSGSSTSEDSNYDIWDGFGEDPGWLGRLLGPIIDRYGIAGTWVHLHCAVWSPEVYFAGLGRLKNVRAALCRGRSLKCTRCGRPGATIGCRVDRCPRTYHLPCARANGCIFDHRKFLIACTDHRYLFQPHGRQCRVRMKRMKAKRMRLEMRKRSNDARRKDVEAEEKWFEKCGEDEEFLKRESKRLHRDLLRVAPVYIGGSDSENGKVFEGWDSVAGLEAVIQCMKEVVILPLLYPEFFDNFGLPPPRGILLHGHPGTGKTLVVRALIGSLARGDKRIAYFARKGADCLGKYVGDAERQLRLLFQVAEKCQPSIIFFDEIDGLAPRRTRQQDQTHSSVVSTLLALLDGLKSRGSVVVIGATNCPDAIDPALRRPGRFDREIYFPLPSLEDRASIISLHTKKWPKPVSGYLLKWIAKETAGFAGADLQALCTQAVMIALKRNFPLQEFMTTAQLNIPGANRVTLPDFSVEERDWLEALSGSPPPCSRRGAGIAASDIFSSPLPVYLVPSLLRPLCSLLVAFHLEERISLPPVLSKVAADVQNVILSALRNKKIDDSCWWAHVGTLLLEGNVVKNMARNLSCAGILNGGFDMDGSTGGGDCDSEFAQSMIHRVYPHPRLVGNVSFEPGSKSGFQVLISGGPKSGQRHLASCILHCFIGNVEVHKIDMATISQEGNGDLVQGLTHLLIKGASRKSCVLFMPRIDLWATEAPTPLEEDDCQEVDYKDDSGKGNSSVSCDIPKQDQYLGLQCETEKTMELQGAIQVSRVWNTFIEQVESLRVSTTMMILATSGVPYDFLPDKIRQFFKTDLSKGYLPTSSEAVPQFTVQVVENFDRDMAINLSATELSRQAIQLFVHLIHQKAHTHDNIAKECRMEDSVECSRDAANQNDTGHSTGGETEHNSKLADDFSMRMSPLPISRNVKEKSSLQLAVSTFGYQILRYPHFAELCWVTSKLKEGPGADASGPWRGWPFNSCIIRPSNSSEQAVTASVSSNIKGKESSGIVRGLIAVGLSAYRGTYKSLREVSFDVRKVFELLVGRINEKVNSGKDRNRYVRILSQVAYLEDVINSWAYMMRSFESVQTELTNPVPPAVGNPSGQNEQAEEGVSCRSCPCSKRLEENSNGSTQNIDHPNQSNNIGNLDPSGVTGIKECSATESVLFVSPVESNNPTDNRQLQRLVETIDGHTGKNPEPYGFENAGNFATYGTDGSNLNNGNGDMVTSLGKAVAESGVSSSRQAVLLDLNCPASDHEQNGNHHGSCDMETTGIAAAPEGKANSQYDPIGTLKSNSLVQKNSHNAADSSNSKLSECCEATDGINCLKSVNNNPEHVNQVEDLNLPSSARSGPEGDTSLVCLYRCCSRCFSLLQDLMFKLVTQELGLGRDCVTTECLHDAVASLSVELTAAVRKFMLAKNIGTREDAKVEYENGGCPERKACPCKPSDVVTAVECCCHSAEGSIDEANTSESPKSWFDPVFLFRDGILVPIDTEKDRTSHCRYDNFCLCSLIESLVTRNRMKHFR